MHAKFVITDASTVNPDQTAHKGADQTAHKGAVCPWFILFLNF